jgi:hypothetical protein
MINLWNIINRKLRVLILILILICIISSVFFISLGKVSAWSVAEGYKTYANKDYNFSFDYPSSWIETGPAWKMDVARFSSSNPTIVASTAEKEAVTIFGLPTLSVAVAPYDDGSSYKAEIGKDGIVNITNLSSNDVVIGKDKIEAKERVSMFSNQSLLSSAYARNREYQTFSLIFLDQSVNKRMNVMIILSIAFDPSKYEESYARDILYTLRHNVLSDKKDVVSFSFAEGVGVINELESVEGASILAVVPFGTNVSNLIPTIALSGGAISPLSGVANDFSRSVSYVVTAEDLSTKTYVVTVTVAKNTAKEMIAFSFDDLGIRGKIDEERKIIDVLVPANTDLAKLIATFETTGEIVEIEGVVQETGKSVNDFTKNVIYRVIAENESYQDYEVIIRSDEINVEL